MSYERRWHNPTSERILVYMQLGENDKERIRLEEGYRNEVRQMLGDDLRPKSFLAFLNSSLGLWLLSAFFISGLGVLYQRHEADRRDDDRRTELAIQAKIGSDKEVYKLDREIAYRLSQHLSNLARLHNRYGLIRIKFQQDIPAKQRAADHDADIASAEESIKAVAVVRSLNDSPSKLGLEPLYPDFGNYSLGALMSTLSVLVSTNERQSIESARGKLLDMSGEDDFIIITRDSADAASQMQKSVVLPRWRLPQFPNMACTEAKPFCESDAIPPK